MSFKFTQLYIQAPEPQQFSLQSTTEVIFGSRDDDDGSVAGSTSFGLDSTTIGRVVMKFVLTCFQRMKPNHLGKN